MFSCLDKALVWTGITFIVFSTNMRRWSELETEERIENAGFLGREGHSTAGTSMRAGVEHVLYTDLTERPILGSNL